MSRRFAQILFVVTVLLAALASVRCASKPRLTPDEAIGIVMNYRAELDAASRQEALKLCTAKCATTDDSCVGRCQLQTSHSDLPVRQSYTARYADGKWIVSAASSGIVNWFVDDRTGAVSEPSTG
jgi:hypothetical protein